MRTVTTLSKMNGKVYAYLKDKSTLHRFLADAENEGFTFCDSVKPTARNEHADIYAVNPDRTINFVGYVGHLAFHHADTIGNEQLIKIDYYKYLNNENNYITN